MGKNTRKYTLLQINKYLLFCIDTDKIYKLLYKSTHLILKESHSPSVEGLMKIIRKINWDQEETVLIKDLKKQIESFNQKHLIPQENSIETTNSPINTTTSIEVPPNIDSLILASGALSLMQHGQILPKPNLAASISVQILLNQILKYINAFENPTTCEKEITNQFLQFIGQLCMDGMLDSAQAIHNFLHLGYLIAAKAAKNKMSAKNVSIILGPNLLDSLEIDDFIYNNKQDPFKKDFWGTESKSAEYNLIAQITHLLLQDEYFSKPFNAKLYVNYNQAMGNKNLCELLWPYVNYNRLNEDQLRECNLLLQLKPISNELDTSPSTSPTPNSPKSSQQHYPKKTNPKKQRKRSANILHPPKITKQHSISFSPTEKTDKDDNFGLEFESLTFSGSLNKRNKTNPEITISTTTSPRSNPFSRRKS